MVEGKKTDDVWTCVILALMAYRCADDNIKIGDLADGQWEIDRVFSTVMNNE